MLTVERGKAGTADRTGFSRDRATVAVVIPVFNQARFLADALNSIQTQTRQADEIIVVDDGSTSDDPATVVVNFRNVRLIRQENRGLAGARNTGLRCCTASHVIFLDADDRLLPVAIETGLACAMSHPECAMVYGGYRRVWDDGRPLEADSFTAIEGDAHLTLLRGNVISAIHTVLFRRDCLIAVDGFDETFRRAEDNDLFLRISQRYPIAGHPHTVAEYRMHSQNMSSDHGAQLKAVLRVLDLHEPRISSDARERAALHEGRVNRKSHYIRRMLKDASIRFRNNNEIRTPMSNLIQATLWSPSSTMRVLLGALARRVSRIAPRPVIRLMGLVRGKPYPMPLGRLRFGDLRRRSPISDNYGLDRGKPIDRHYIEAFMTKNEADVFGHVLELHDNSYTQRFGGTRVTRSDVLSVESTNPRATIVGDLIEPKSLPEGVFDCIILTQVLQCIFELDQAIDTLHRALKPGGVLLVTTPGITRMQDQWPWYWSFTAPALQKLLRGRFGQDTVTVEAHGNVFAAAAFLYGLAAEELESVDLDADDSRYPVIVSARAVKRTSP